VEVLDLLLCLLVGEVLLFDQGLEVMHAVVLRILFSLHLLVAVLTLDLNMLAKQLMVLHFTSLIAVAALTIGFAFYY